MPFHFFFGKAVYSQVLREKPWWLSEGDGKGDNEVVGKSYFYVGKGTREIHVAEH
jgi:hypothetical protein